MQLDDSTQGEETDITPVKVAKRAAGKKRKLDVKCHKWAYTALKCCALLFVLIILICYYLLTFISKEVKQYIDN